MVSSIVNYESKLKTSQCYKPPLKASLKYLDFKDFKDNLFQHVFVIELTDETVAFWYINIDYIGTKIPS